MRAKNALIVGMVVVLAIMALVAVGCGGSDEEAKATLSAALTKVETSITEFQKMDATSTVADIKAARDAVAADWAAVVTAAKGVKGADAAAAEKAWTDVDQAINSLADDAPILEAAGVIMAPVNALLKVEADLRALVTPSK